MRKETSNQFTEGLVSDLNPITTPNTVLTDNLNGTIITYNGNEFSLQNDQGNYELKHCRLKPNYIPVGIKEYGDILYIVSYNPLDKHVEIGSYPSPLMITTPNENSANNIINSIIEEAINETNKEEDVYSDLMKRANSIIFNGDIFKLNPGDEYCLQLDDFKKYKFETLDYFVLDDDSNIHDITYKIKIDENLGELDYENVPWVVPGWIMIKSRLAEIGTSGLNVRYFYVIDKDEISSAHYSFNIKLNVSDPYLLHKDINGSIIDEWCDKISSSLQDIKFRLKLEKQVGNDWISISDNEYVDFQISGEQLEDIILGNSGWVEWYGDCKILWKNISGVINNLTNVDIIKVSLTPILFDGKYSIIYDNLEQSLLFDLSQKDTEDYNIGTNIYKFYRNDEQQYIYTNISGSLITSSITHLFYEIYDVYNNKILEKELDNWGIGDCVLQIPFVGDFKPENLYKIKFVFRNDNGDELNSISRILITSKIFNEYINVYSIFDLEIDFKTWSSNYINNCDLSIEYSPILSAPTNNDEVYGIKNGERQELTENDEIFLSNQMYCTIQPVAELSNQICYQQNLNYNISGTLEKHFSLLDGDLWKGMDIELFYNDEPWNNNIIINCYKKHYYEYNEEQGPFEWQPFTLETVDNWEYNGASVKDLRLSLSFACYKDIMVSCDCSIIKNGEWTQLSGEGAGSSEKIFYIYKMLSQLNIPFILLKVYSWQLDDGPTWSTLNDGALDYDNELEPDFIYKLSKGGEHKEAYFIALNQAKEDLPIIIPLSKDENEALNMYRNFCDSLYIISDVGGKVECCDLRLNKEDKIESKLDLDFKVFAKLKTSDWVYLDQKYRNQIIANWDILNSNLLQGDFESTNCIEIYSKTFEEATSESFDDNKLLEFDDKIKKINIDRKSDYENNANQIWALENRRSLKGVYFKNRYLNNDKLLEYFNDNYCDFGYLGINEPNRQIEWSFSYKDFDNKRRWAYYGGVLPIKAGEQLIRLDTYWPQLNKSNES